MSFSKVLLKGVKWTTLDSFVGTFLQFMQNIILARLLSPDDFGVMAIIMVIIGFIQPFFEFGLGNAIIQKKETNQEKLSTLYWVNICLGLFCFLLTVWVSFFISFFFARAGLQKLLILTGLTFIISPWGSQYTVLMIKELMFALQAKISMACTLFTFIISITFALLGMGVYTLVYAYLLKELFKVGLNIFHGRSLHKPLFYFNLNEVADILKFGFFETGSRIVNFFSANIDKVLIGGLLGTHSLGLYTIAWNLVLFPLRKINPIITKVSFPLFSKINDNQVHLNKYYRETLLILMMVSFPILLFLSTNAEDLLQFLYGDQWVTAADVLFILSIVGLLKSFGNPGGFLLLAKGRADVGLYWNIFWSISLYILMSTFLRFKPTIEAVAFAQLVGGVTLGWIWHSLIIKIGNVNYTILLKHIVSLFMYTIPYFLLTWSFDHFFDFYLVSGLVIKLALLGFTFLLYLYLFFKQYLLLLLKIVR